MKKVVIVAVALSVVAVVIGFITGYIGKDSETVEAPTVGGTTASDENESPGSTTEQINGQQTGSDAELATEWHQIIPEGESNLGHTGYDELALRNGTKYVDYAQQFNPNGDWSVAYNIQVSDAITSTGHRVYVNTTDYSEEATYTGQDGMYGSPFSILCGNALLPIDYNKELSKDEGFLLREEGGGTRIRLYSTQEELDKAKEQYKNGQDVLNGKAEIKKGMIVLDGQLISDTWREDEDGNIILPFANVAMAYSEGTNITKDGVLCVPLDEPRGIYISIPSRDAAGWEAGEKLLVNKETNSWKYTAIAIPGTWSEEFPLTDRKYEISALEVVKLMGWNISTNGVVVNIITDKYNNNDNFMLRSW